MKNMDLIHLVKVAPEKINQLARSTRIFLQFRHPSAPWLVTSVAELREKYPATCLEFYLAIDIFISRKIMGMKDSPHSFFRLCRNPWSHIWNGCNGKSVFDWYRKGGCHSGGGETPENVRKNEVFYRALFSYVDTINFIWFYGTAYVVFPLHVSGLL